jgi:hypothetical protein
MKEKEKNAQWFPQPSPKTAAMDATITALTGIDRRKAITSKLCSFCGAKVTLDSFNDELSLKEFHVSGLCQQCQDRAFG